MAISGAKGEVKEYPLSPAPAPEGGWACRLGDYLVTYNGAWWHCTCDHNKHKGACKHARDGKAIHALVSLWLVPTNCETDSPAIPEPPPDAPKPTGGTMLATHLGGPEKAAEWRRKHKARLKAEEAARLVEAAQEAFPPTPAAPRLVMPGPAPVTRDDVESMIQAAVKETLASVAKMMKGRSNGNGI